MRSRFDVIDDITPEIEAMAGDAGSGLSKGGMKTKVMAARTATAAGCAMAITEGSVLRPLTALEEGANATWFTAQVDPQAARKRWIAAMKPQGSITLDAGAGRGPCPVASPCCPLGYRPCPVTLAAVTQWRC